MSIPLLAGEESRQLDVEIARVSGIAAGNCHFEKTLGIYRATAGKTRVCLSSQHACVRRIRI